MNYFYSASDEQSIGPTFYRDLRSFVQNGNNLSRDTDRKTLHDRYKVTNKTSSARRYNHHN